MPNYLGHLSSFSVTTLLFILATGCGETLSIPPIPHETLRNGDLAFRRGIGYASDAVVIAGSGKYSHVGIIIKTDKGWSVVHAVPDERPDGETVDRIKCEPIADFFAPNRAIRGEIIRIACPDSTAGKAAAIALTKTGTPFDHDYDLNDSTALYCTELVRNVFQRTGLPLNGCERLTHITFPFYDGDYLLPSAIYTNNREMTLYKY